MLHSFGIFNRQCVSRFLGSMMGWSLISFDNNQQVRVLSLRRSEDWIAAILPVVRRAPEEEEDGVIVSMKKFDEFLREKEAENFPRPRMPETGG